MSQSGYPELAGADSMKSILLPPYMPDLQEEYAVMSFRYDWLPKRGTIVGLAVGLC